MKKNIMLISLIKLKIYYFIYHIYIYMSESLILFTIIGSTLLNPFLNYLVHSRCTHLKCGCIECDRDVKEEPDKEQKTTSTSTNQL
jgi:hypothetical protein